MKAVFHNYDGKLYLEDIPKPAAGPDEVLIRIAYSCICDDEIQVVNGGSNYFRTYNTFSSNGMQGIGHEASGIVEQSCPKALEQGIVEGMEVTVHPNIFCGKCHYCLSGKENLCLHRKSTMRMMREYITVNYRNVYPLRGRIGLKEGSLVQPVACVLRAVENAGISIGQSVLVIGNTFASIIMVMLARQRGAKLISVIGFDDYFLRSAIQHGADYAFSIQKPEDIAKAMNVTDCLGYDVVLETSWLFINKDIAMGMLARGGTIVYFSQVNTNATLSFNAFETFWKEATIRTAYGFPFGFERTIDCIKMLDLESLTATTFSVEDIQEAYESICYGHNLKAIIRFNEFV